MCMYTMTYLSFSCELGKMSGLLSQKCLAGVGTKHQGAQGALFSRASISALMFNATAA